MANFLHTSMPFDIFKLNFPKKQHNDHNNIFKIILLNNSNILVIDTQKSYTLYETLSQKQTVIVSEGRFEHQLADNFEELFFNGKSLILYSVEDVIYLHDIKRNKRVDSLQFKENKLTYSSIYEEEYKLRLVSVWDETKTKYQIPYVLLFWKVSAMYKSGNREIFLELRVLKFGTKINQTLVDKLSLLSQLKDINENLFKQIHFQPHKQFPKPIKIQSQNFLDFTFTFGYPISYQTEGYHIEFSFLSLAGEIKRKLTINSIYNQLVKEVVPLKDRILILTKHQSMNLEELQRDDDEQNIHQHQHQQQNLQTTEDFNEGIKNAENQLFKEDFKFDEKIEIKFMKQKFNHLFDFQTSSTQDKLFEEDQIIDIYCITLEKHVSEENYQMEDEKIDNKINSIKPENLKLIKLYSSISIKELSNILSLTPNLTDNLSKQFKHSKLLKLQGLQNDVKECNLLTDSKESLQNLYYENIFTSNENIFRKASHLQPSSSQLMKINYSKPVLYMKILQEILENDQSKNSLTESSNLSELNYNNGSKNSLEPTEKVSPNQTVQNSFKQLVLSLLQK